ncbi:ATP-binding protein [Pseudofulvibacter geojedonensis]|uniref:histidine kinase n=2 Tax=Pseudofulvibacter geojedonensis TaxID=1123758 RepID=A0ABW3I3L6_9FLAO
MEHYLKQELYELIKSDSKIFDFIQKGSLDGIWYWDLEKPENEWMSEKFWTELGYNPNKMPHKASAWQGIINQDDLNLAIENFNKHCSDPTHPYDQTVRYIHKNGSTVYIRCRGIAIRDDKGKPIRMLGAHTNITEITESKIEIEEINRQLNEKNKELEQFTYLTSHDLQEPLNSIISFSSLLEGNKENLDEIGKKSIEVIVNSSHRMKDFIIALLEYSRIGKQKVKEEVNIIELIKNLKTDLYDIIDKNEASINYIGKPLKIQAFKIDLIKLIQNLIINGIKYTDTETKPKIVIDIKEHTQHYEFSIKDNGIGIAKEHYDKIFEVFQRLHTRNKFSGTGIGLSHCKKVVELHGGEIWLTSEIGKGTTFYFTISK